MQENAEKVETVYLYTCVGTSHHHGNRVGCVGARRKKLDDIPYKYVIAKYCLSIYEAHRQTHRQAGEQRQS